MTTKTSTKTTTKSTTTRTPAKTTAKPSNTTITASKDLAKVTRTSSKESVKIVPNVTFQKATILTKEGQATKFFLETYSDRCLAITAENFETVYYFGFPTEQAATNFVKAILGKFCKECSFRSSKRFNPDDFPYEVKVWGLSCT